MISITLAILMISVGGNAICDCKSGDWAHIVDRTEALIIHKEPIRVPKDPLGTKYNKSCVRLVFDINPHGFATNVRIDLSSENRALDRSAIAALEKYRFRSADHGETKAPAFALIFRIGY
jgi:TonB family protein